MSIGLFQKKSQEAVGWWYIYISEKTIRIYIFVTLFLQINLSPRKIPHICATPLGNSKTKTPRPIENSHDLFLITPTKTTCFLIDSEISACFFQYTLKFHVLNSPYLIFLNRVEIEMCLDSIILKEIRGGWIRKDQVLLFFMLRQLKTTDSLRNSDEVAWNVTLFQKQIFVEVLKTASTKHLNFVKFTEKDLCQSLFFKTLRNFKRRRWHKCFPLISAIFLKHIFLQNAFRSLLLLLEKPLRNPWEITTKPTTRILLQ